jgi:hypothetical protein
VLRQIRENRLDLVSLALPVVLVGAAAGVPVGGAGLAAAVRGVAVDLQPRVLPA